MRCVQRWESGRGRKWGRRLFAGGMLAFAALVACTTRPVAELSPKTSNISVELVANAAVDKIDLLFMIDNSISMSDKQVTLSQAVPALVRRLVTPPCLGEGGVPLKINADAEGRCAQGRPEFRPIRDIHIGVITSSLGAHGGEGCIPNDRTPDTEDNAHLLGTLPRGSGLSTNNLGFLKWAPDGGGESDPDALIDKFTTLVQKVQETGCGYESSLEAWYRFLIDPEPPLTVTAGAGDFGTVTLSGTDTALLEQRAKFLRPDSLVAIVMLTDENDCSIRDENGFMGHWVTRHARAFRATSTCEKEPNSPCCRSCVLREDQAPEGCVPLAEDPSCNSTYLDKVSDPPNLRCFEQKRRFGIDLLWPTSRYVQGLTEPRVPNARGELVANPLFQAPPGVLPRQRSQVFLAGIVGVPWQDIATPASLTDHGLLEYLPYRELTSQKRWDVIVGSPSTHVPPQDVFMVEAIAERKGTNPILGVPTAPSGSRDPRANAINGHEADYSSSPVDLQYACTYPLPAPRDCSDNLNCDCVPEELGFKRPLCHDPTTGAIGTMQHFAKAYPGLRTLEVLKDVGARTSNAIVGSICPKLSKREERDLPSYGYNPAMHALVDRLKEGFRGACMSRELNLRPDGSLPCTVVETQPVALEQSCGADDAPPSGCDAARNRKPASRQLARSVREELRKVGACGIEGQPACSEFCMCQILPVSGPALSTCQNNPDDDQVQSSEEGFGYCYVDPQPPPRGQGIGALEVVAPPRCDETRPRRLRFMGKDTPAKNTLTLMACAGESG